MTQTLDWDRTIDLKRPINPKDGTNDSPRLSKPFFHWLKLVHQISHLGGTRNIQNNSLIILFDHYNI